MILLSFSYFLENFNYNFVCFFFRFKNLKLNRQWIFWGDIADFFKYVLDCYCSFIYEN